MAAFTTGLWFVVWNGPQTVLTSAPWKSNVGGGVFKINTARTAFVSFKPASQFNNVTMLDTGSLYLFRVTTAFTLADALVTVVQGGGGSDSIALSGPDGVTVSEFEESYTATTAAVPSVLFSSGTGTVQYSLNGGASWAALPGSIPAATPFLLRVQHTAAFSATLTLTY